MKKKTIVLLLSFALTSSFFFPIFNWNSFELSGPNYILSDHTPPYKYILLLIPLISVRIFLGTLYNENLVFTRGLVWIPLLALMFVFIVNSIREGLGNVLSMTGIGFWLILLFSLSLALARGKQETIHSF